MTTNFEPHEYVIFVQSTKIGTYENKTTNNIQDIKILKTILKIWINEMDK